MTLVVFTGPTISAADARDALGVADAVFLPPAAQGDVYRAARERPVAIGIVDGYFERVPSVSHKEILWAMSEGVHVFGAASMGALRAAELAPFGMEGVGAVFEAYLRGEIDADDEVAVAHGSAEDGYRATSEAMVNIRATLRAAERAEAISEGARAAFERVAKGLFYPDRCYPILLRHAAKEGVPPADIDALQAFVPAGRVHQKRLDAIAMLHVLRDRFAGRAEPKRVAWRFEPTDAWELIRGNAERGAFASRAPEMRVDPAVDELRRSGDAGSARLGALARAMAVEIARRQNRAIGGEARRAASEVFRRERGLLDRADFQRWIDEHAVADLDRFFDDEARLQWAEATFGAAADRLLADHLRATGAYGPLLARARGR